MPRELLDAAQFAQLNLPSPRWAFPGLIPGYGVSLLISPPKKGKSILSLQICHAMARGLPCLGEGSGGSPRKALYVESDAPAGEVQQQLKDRAWFWGEGGPGGKILTVEAGPDNLVLPFKPLSRVGRRGFLPEEWIEAIHEYQAELTFWATAFSLDYIDFREGEAIAPFFEKVKQFPGAHVVLHHSRKDPPPSKHTVMWEDMNLDEMTNAIMGSQFIAGGASNLLFLQPHKLTIWGRTFQPTILLRWKDSPIGKTAEERRAAGVWERKPRPEEVAAVGWQNPVEGPPPLICPT